MTASEREKEITALFLRAYSTEVKVITREHTVCTILEDISVENIATREGFPLEELFQEAIFESDPDYIFVVTIGDEDASIASLEDSLLSNPAFASLSAVQNGQLIILSKDLYHYKPNNRWGKPMKIWPKSSIPKFSSKTNVIMLFLCLFITALLFVYGLFVGAAFLSARMNVLALGDEVTASLGLHVSQCRILTIFCAALLAACAVCVGGLLGFVGLIVPHVARFIIGRGHKLLVPFTALFGGGLVTGCDILSRVLFVPYELPVGILLSMLGAPFFLFLVLRGRGSAL